MTIDSNDNLYLTGPISRTVRKVTPAGVVSTMAGYHSGNQAIRGSIDGSGTGAFFDNPSAIAVDSSGSVYVFDSYHHNLRKITSNNIVTTFAALSGTAYNSTSPIANAICVNSIPNPYSCDGIGNGAKFGDVTAAGVDEFNNLYFADYGNIIRKINLNTAQVKTIGGQPGDVVGGLSLSGTGFDVRFDVVREIILDKTAAPGTMLISNTEGSCIVIGSGLYSL
jgi:hypothetical protein